MCAASCTVVRAWEASIIGLIAGAITTYGGPFVARFKIDDPVGVIPVHFMCGAWVRLKIAYKKRKCVINNATSC